MTCTSYFSCSELKAKYVRYSTWLEKLGEMGDVFVSNRTMKKNIG